MPKNLLSTDSLERAAREHIKLNRHVAEAGEVGYGHDIGAKLEAYARNMLQKSLPGLERQMTACWPHEFLNKLQRKHQASGLDHINAVAGTWWGNLLLQGKPTLKAYQQTQGMGADLVCHHEETPDDAGAVILINVKSRNTARKGRPPNIISAYRLLNYFSNMCYPLAARGLLEEIRYWVLGFDHKSGVVQNAHVKDLLKLDVSRMPPINFDAAMQIQWHVGDMATLPRQTPREFISKFTTKFNEDWKKHKERRDERIHKSTDAVQKSLWLDPV